MLLKKYKWNYYMIQHFHFCIFSQRKQNHKSEKLCAPLCLLHNFFIIDKIRKQPQCTSVDEWLRNIGSNPNPNFFIEHHPSPHYPFRWGLRERKGSRAGKQAQQKRKSPTTQARTLPGVRGAPVPQALRPLLLPVPVASPPRSRP